MRISEKFTKGLDFSLKWEGGFSDHPSDYGGATNFGITQKTYSDWLFKKGIGDRPVQQITKQETEQIYWEEYWLPSGAESFILPLAIIHFDTAVNFGVWGAFDFLEEATGLKDLEQIKRIANNVETAIAYCHARIEYRHRRCQENPSQKAFLQGWLNRDNDLLKVVRSLSGDKLMTTCTKKAVLNVPYFSQRDNYREAHRTCFSSACAMLLKYLKKSSIVSDDDYLDVVFRIGDTTEAWVQIAALKEFGVSAQFSQGGKNETLKDYLDRGIPVPIGILHQGPAHAPSGGGHWIIVVGYEDDASAPGGGWWLVHDPWGEIDHASGTYISTNGKGLDYSYNLLNARWTVDGTADGWCLLAEK